MGFKQAFKALKTAFLPLHEKDATVVRLMWWVRDDGGENIKRARPLKIPLCNDQLRFSINWQWEGWRWLGWIAKTSTLADEIRVHFSLWLPVLGRGWFSLRQFHPTLFAIGSGIAHKLRVNIICKQSTNTLIELRTMMSIHFQKRRKMRRTRCLRRVAPRRQRLGTASQHN